MRFDSTKRMFQNPKPCRVPAGFSLVELLVYIALLSILLVSLLTAIDLMMRTWQSAQGRTALARAGAAAMGRLEFKIRAAASVDSAGSSFGASPGVLELDATDGSGNATTTTFSVSNGQLMVAAGTGSAEPLLPSGVGVESLTFYQITTANSQAVRIVLALEAATSSATTTAAFYDTAVLRGSY